MTAPRIALLDNDPALLSLMHALLIDEGYRTVRCRPDDVLSVHALVKRARPALVVLDCWVAKRDDGWAFLKQLWGDAETTQIPAVLLTRAPDRLPVPADLLSALHCRVVTKPFALQDLRDAIAALLGSSPLQRERHAHLHALPAATTANAAVPDLLGASLVAAGEDA